MAIRTRLMLTAPCFVKFTTRSRSTVRTSVRVAVTVTGVVVVTVARLVTVCPIVLVTTRAKTVLVEVTYLVVTGPGTFTRLVTVFAGAVTVRTGNVLRGSVLVLRGRVTVVVVGTVTVDVTVTHSTGRMQMGALEATAALAGAETMTTRSNARARTGTALIERGSLISFAMQSILPA